MSESVKSSWLSCAALDVIAIHAYGVGDFTTSNIQTYVNQAKSAGKKLIFQEWGACYFNTDNNNCPTGTALATSTRNNNIQVSRGRGTNITGTDLAAHRLGHLRSQRQAYLGCTGKCCRMPTRM